MKRSLAKATITLRDVILGGQDGLVNVLGISLGLFTAHASTRVILIAAIAAGFSEAISMGAVAFTSARADKEIVQKKTSVLVFDSIVVGVSALLGSLIPIVPFLILPEGYAVLGAIILGGLTLFSLGFLGMEGRTSKKTRSGLEILFIGLLSAFAGFGIGWLLKV